MNIVRHCRGFSLLELIGVMAVMAILAGVMAPNLFDSIDQAYADAEVKNLEVLAENLESYIIANKKIPKTAPASWAAAIATVSGYPQQSIEFNEKNFRRRLIADPRFFTSKDSKFKGFTQKKGLLDAPVSPRILFISDLTRHVQRVPNTSKVFDSIWNQAKDSPLQEGRRLKIQRINLNDIFHRIILSNQHSKQPFYQLEDGPRVTVPTSSGGLDGLITRYIIDSTQLNLFVEPYPSGDRARVAVVQSGLSMRYQTDGFNWSWEKQ